jgi:hypothetical protein
MQHKPGAPGPDKESRRRAREDKLAVALRENLLRRKAQARTRKGDGAGGAGGEAPAPPSVDLEAEGVVHDTNATHAVTGGDT